MIVAGRRITNLLKLNSIEQSVRHVFINIRERDKTKIPAGKFNTLVSYLANRINKINLRRFKELAPVRGTQ